MQNATQDKVGWIGLGALGFETTQNLQKYLQSKSQPNLTVWNRSAEKTQKLIEIDPTIQAATSIEDIFAQSNIIFTSLANDPAVIEVYEILIRCAETARTQVIFVETGTIYPELARGLQKRLSNLPQRHIYLQCPVFGRPEAAKAGQLLWVASGHAGTIARLHPMFMSMSYEVLDLKDEDVAAGCTMKLIGNFMIMAQTEILAEGINLARKSNLDPQHVIAFVDAFLPAPVIKNSARRLASNDEAEVAVDTLLTIASKDLTCVNRWAQTCGAPLPTANLVLDHFKTAREKGFDKNWGFMINSINSAAEAREQ
ncbi:hypothetical protein CPB97_011753 [Podila verticillata]|nr:hypothetical protein CPB97_011753 [Podila verticillata]